VLRLDRRLVALPVLSVGRIGDQVVEVAAGVAVVGERAAEGDLPRVAPGRVLHEEVRLGEGPRFWVHLLTEQVDLRLRIDRGPEHGTVGGPALQNVLLGDHQHPARTAARVVDAADHAGSRDPRFVAREHQVHHQMDHVPRREVLAGVLVEGLVEPADQLLEDRPHRRVVHRVRMEIDLAEALQHLEEQAGLVELADRVVEIEPLDHLPHVLAEARDVVAEVGGRLRRVGQKPVEVVAGGVVEGEAGGSLQLAAPVFQAAVAQLGVPRQDLLLGGSEDAVEAAEDGEREDHVLVLPALEAVADQVRDVPDEADDFGVGHGVASSLTKRSWITPGTSSSAKWQRTASSTISLRSSQSSPWVKTP